MRAAISLAGAGAALAVIAAQHGDTARLILGLVLVAVLVPVTWIDLERRLIPNRITGPAAAAAIALGLALDPDGQPERLLAGALAGGAFLTAALVSPAGMGMGDVKLAGVLGLFLGRAVGPALLVALTAAALVGLVIVARVGVREGRRTGVAFGPFLALGGAVGAIVGEDVVAAYLEAA